MIVFYDAAPVRVNHRGLCLPWSDTFLPVVLVGKAASWPTQFRDFDPFLSLYDIVADPACIGDAEILPTQKSIIDASAQMLGKMTIDVAVYLVHRSLGIDCDRGFHRESAS